jgi:hypothetical protein
LLVPFRGSPLGAAASVGLELAGVSVATGAGSGVEAAHEIPPLARTATATHPARSIIIELPLLEIDAADGCMDPPLPLLPGMTAATRLRDRI